MTHPGGPSPEQGRSTPWSGRTLRGSGADADAGRADPEVVAALAAYTQDPGIAQQVELMTRVRGARWIVPIVAAAGEVDQVDGLTVEKSADMAAVTLTGPDGRRALPIFSSASALAAWRPEARPVPVTAARAAQAAITERCEVLVIDVGSAQAVELRPSMVWALAQAGQWLPAHQDPFVARAVAAAVDSEELVTRHAVEDGQPAATGVLRVVLAVSPGLAADDLEALVTRIGERLATDGEFRARVDELAFSLSRS